MQYKDYYAILGVDKKASQDDIKHAYRKLARKYHPDVSKEPNAEEQFKNVQEAYEVLKDPEKRAAYNQLGSEWKAGQDFRPPPDWQQAHTRFYTNGENEFAEADLGGFSDFFTHLFGQAGFSREGVRGFKQRGSDQHAKIQISLEEAFHGVSKTFQMQIPEIDTSGRVHTALRTIKVNIPPGVMPGQQLRLGGQGSVGAGGGGAGDLYLEIDIQTHSRFSLQNKDIFMTLPITPWEAALGAHIKVPTLGGAVGLKLTAGSQAGQKLRLKGRGMPGKPFGDQYVILQIETPPVKTEEQRQLYENMARIMPFNPREHWVI
ncbi:MAG: cytochrome C biogenesis protein [Gammaproteobacteria bacterium RIFCSPHIGHO2_12_FULL_37_34]|nr:MAG: cytochrome C biogenesis protein [Gammaproteobacteria bacterium RIFCSPHIGHO2_12_FULL_37_34]